MKEQQSLCI